MHTRNNKTMRQYFYIAPDIEVVEIEIEQPILNGSDGGEIQDFFSEDW